MADYSYRFYIWFFIHIFVPIYQIVGYGLLTADI